MSRLGIRSYNSRWTDEKEQYLIDNYVTLGPTKCALELNMPKTTIVSRVNYLGIQKVSKPGGRGRSRTGYAEITGDFWSQITGRARRGGIDISITPKDGWELFLQQGRKCAVAGNILTFPRDSSKFEKNNATASLDRIDSSGGYSILNCEWIHKKFQVMKMDFSKEDFIANCREVVEYHKLVSSKETLR